MKAQLVKTFIKAAAIVALATSIANCGAMPEESITESTYQPTSENTDTTTNNDDEEETTHKTPSRSTEPVKDGCEAFGLVYDAANNTCVEDDTDTNIINPPVTEEPTVIVDNCEAFGLVYDEIAGECVTGIEPTEAVEEGEAFGFTVTPGNMHFLATWEADALVSYYTIEKWREVSSSPQETTSAETEWTFATAFCTAHSFKLVATLTDGSTVETSLLGPFKPTNCE